LQDRLQAIYDIDCWENHLGKVFRTMEEKENDAAIFLSYGLLLLSFEARIWIYVLRRN